MIDASSGLDTGTITLDNGLSAIYGGTYYDGMLYLASSDQDKIVKVDPADGDWITIADELPIEGADIEFKNGELFFATREDDKLYRVDFDDNDDFTFTKCETFQKM